MKPKINVTPSGTGKMKGISSNNDNPESNPYCIGDCPNKDICYAKFFTQIYIHSRVAFARIGNLMSKRKLFDHEVPRFMPYVWVRLHSFGEYRNLTHLQNHILIAETNPMTPFRGWTHRQDLIAQVKLPPNMSMILSGITDTIYTQIPEGFVGVYVTVTPAFAEREGIDIFCDGQQGMVCRRCYGKGNPGIVYAKLKPYSVK